MQFRYSEEEIKQDEQEWKRWWENRGAVDHKRILKKWERMKRGCEVCAHVYRTTRGELFGETRVDDMGFKKNERLYICPFARCPLHEMDKYKNYGAYYTATKAENDRILKKAFNIKVRKAMKKKLKVETKLPKKFISSRKRWLIGCRDNQGFSIEDIAREFEISEEQAKEVVEEYRSMR